jgi:hypothetical protein
MVAKTVPVKRPTQKQQRRQSTGYLLGGVIGAAIASGGSGPEKYVQFDVPFCQECVARDRKFKAASWITLVLGFIAVITGPVIAASQDVDDYGTLVSLVVLLGVGLLIAAIVLFWMVWSRKPVKIKAVKDNTQGAVLDFRDATYQDEFRQANLARLIPYELQAGLTLSASPDQALAIVSEGINDEQPSAEGTVIGHLSRALIHMRGQSDSQAVEELNKVIAAAGQTMPNAYFLRAQALMNLARHQEAAADLETFIQVSSDRKQVRAAKKLLKQVSSYR